MIYLLLGEDEYLRNEYLKKIKKAFGELQLGINYVQIDENNVSNIILDIETPAFGYPQKLIIAKDTGLFQKAKKGTKASSVEKKDNKFENVLADYINENIKRLESWL